MPSEKRARQRAARAQKQAVIQQVVKRRRTLRRVIWAVLLVAVVVVIAVLLNSSGSKKTTTGEKSGSSSSTSTSSTSSTTTSTVKIPTTTFATPTTLPLATTAVAPTCPPTSGSKSREVFFTKAPPDCINKTSVWDATLVTSAGKFVVEMDASKSYAAINNFVFLALWQYYNGTLFHRVIPGFVVQGGDAAGTGDGGPHHYPGYSYTGNTPSSTCKTAPTGPTCYVPGDLAMANSGAPSSNGSQFFVVLPGGETVLNGEPVYTNFGKVTSGMSVVEKIGAWGTQAGTPAVKVYLLNVTVKQVKA